MGGATGAGQGYLWMAHRDPASPLWQLAARSRELWQEFLPAQLIEYQPLGSLLLASDQAESDGLRVREGLLRQAGVQAELLSVQQAQQLEPALRLGTDGAALLVSTDVQVRSIIPSLTCL
jgi:glycine/D-amino acid oxidase-like deaminating enzyme